MNKFIAYGAGVLVVTGALKWVFSPSSPPIYCPACPEQIEVTNLIDALVPDNPIKVVHTRRGGTHTHDVQPTLIFRCETGHSLSYQEAPVCDKYISCIWNTEDPLVIDLSNTLQIND